MFIIIFKIILVQEKNIEVAATINVNLPPFLLTKPVKVYSNSWLRKSVI